MRGRRLLAAKAAWVVVAASVAVAYAAAVPAAHAGYRTVCGAAACDPYWRLVPEDAATLRGLGLSVGLYAAYRTAIELAYGLAFYAVGALVYWRRPDNRVALLVSVALMTFGVLNLVELPSGSDPPLGAAGAVLAFAGFASFFALFYLFPDGRFVPPWGRWLAGAWVSYLACLFLVAKGSPMSAWSWPAAVRLPLALGLLASVVFAQAYRYLRVSGPTARQQTRWVVLGVAAAVTGSTLATLPMSAFPALTEPGAARVAYLLAELPLTNAFLLAVPASIAVALLRYRLWDLDVVVNRALVYAALTACVAGLYVAVVGGLGSLLLTESGLAVSLLATGLIAALLAPLRGRLQRAVNRLMYGERDDPYGVLSSLGRRLEATQAPEVALETVVESVARAMKVPHVALDLEEDGGFRRVGEHGTPTEGEKAIALAHHGERLGRLLVAPRSPGEAFSARDEALLGDLARQAGAAAHAARLTADLRRSRERAVSAREEERRRLRRDLHDGVGPQLAALNLELETASELVADNPEASAFLEKLSERAREAVADVRRSVYGLRPPSLDELGLVPALKETAARLSRGGLKVYVGAPEDLPPLPAAAEVACYRIAQEAMTNASRHARASRCWVRISADGTALEVEVEDDGIGIGGARAGVGMSSMRERAEELGGTLIVGPPGGGGGTLVRALLPLPEGNGGRPTGGDDGGG